VHEVDVLLDALYDTSGSLAHERAARVRLQGEREALLHSEREARRLAETQSAAKDDFLAMLGHELRNPLAAIAGALTVRDIARRQTRHLTRIVDDLLDVRRILSGKVELQKVRVDAGRLLRQCCETRQVVDAGAHTWSVPVPALEVDGDATRLEQVFGNLLHNAIKYTPDGGAIAVRAHTGRRHGRDRGERHGECRSGMRQRVHVAAAAGPRRRPGFTRRRGHRARALSALTPTRARRPGGTASCAPSPAAARPASAPRRRSPGPRRSRARAGHPRCGHC
jgi:signal transduction histidine kinase